MTCYIIRVVAPHVALAAEDLASLEGHVLEAVLKFAFVSCFESFERWIGAEVT